MGFLAGLVSIVLAVGGKAPGARQVAVLKQTIAVDALGETMEAAETPKVLVVAAGCFWGVELAFARLPGVLKTEVGYCGGHEPAPTYKLVSRGTTGHAEAVRITYDSSRVTHRNLTDVFFDCHDPTQRNRQGNDVGTQYRSSLFYATEEERSLVELAVEEESERLGREVATTIEPLHEFWPAESYHQAYLAKLGQTDAKGSTDPIRCYG